MNFTYAGGSLSSNKIRAIEKEKQYGALGRIEDYLLARGRKTLGRYLPVSQRFLEANPVEEGPFKAHHVNWFARAASIYYRRL